MRALGSMLQPNLRFRLSTSQVNCTVLGIFSDQTNYPIVAAQINLYTLLPRWCLVVLTYPTP